MGLGQVGGAFAAVCILGGPFGGCVMVILMEFMDQVRERRNGRIGVEESRELVADFSFLGEKT